MKQQINIGQLTNQIFVQVATFLDPLSIYSFVLTSRQTRIRVGEVMKEILKCQQDFYKNKLAKKSNYKNMFANYYKTLNQMTCLSSNDAYMKFIDQMNEYNAQYYKNFFSIILQKEIRIDYPSFKQQKQGLKEIRSNIYQKLQQIKSQKLIPSQSVQYIQYTDYSVNKTQKIFQFINQFIKELFILQQVPNIYSIQKDFNQVKIYLNQFKHISKLKIQPSLYQKKLYYLTNNISYHTLINFNLNSIIFSFLKVNELQTLGHCDHKFRALIPQMIPILFQNMIKCQEKLSDNLKNQENLQELCEQYSLMQKYNKAKLEIQYIKFLQRSNMQIETINVLYKLLNIKETDQLQFISKFLSKLNCGVCLYPYIIQLNEDQIKILEEYFKKNNSIREIEIVSIGHALIHVNLFVSLKMKQYNLSEQDIWAIQKDLHKIKRLEQHIINLYDVMEYHKILQI